MTCKIDNFEQLVINNSDRLYGFILKHTGDASISKDLVQQTIVEAIKNRYSFRGESAPSTWLFGIARNIVRNYIYRSPNNRYNFVDSDTLSQVEDASDNPEQTIAWKEKISQLEAAIKSLPRKLKEVLILVALENNSYENASRALGISVGTIRSRLSRARTQLKKKYNSRNTTPLACMSHIKEYKLYDSIYDYNS